MSGSSDDQCGTLTGDRSATLIQNRVEGYSCVPSSRWIVAIPKPASLKSPRKPVTTTIISCRPRILQWQQPPRTSVLGRGLPAAQGHNPPTNVRSNAFEDKAVLLIQSSTILLGFLFNIRPKRLGILFEFNKSIDQIVKIQVSKRKAVFCQAYFGHQGI